MALGVWGAERRALYYPGGAFSLDRLAWAFVIENQERPLASVRTPLRVRRALAPAFAHLPLLDADVVAVGHPVGYYRDPVQHDQPGDPYWTPTDFRAALRDLGIPVTMIGGWYDMSLPSMLADYQALADGGQTARLRVGPWHHSSQDLFRYSFQDALEWFGAHLLGRPVADRPPVPPRPPDQAPGLQRRPPSLRAEHRQRRTASDSGNPLHGTAGCLPRPRAPLSVLLPVVPRGSQDAGLGPGRPA